MPITAAKRARGLRAEQIFQQWLDREGVPYFYFDQTPFTVPLNLQGKIKRPDFAVGLGHVGTLAIDVKSYRIIKGHFWVSTDEHHRMLMFERVFNIPVWFAFFPPSYAPYCNFIRNADLHGCQTATNAKGTFLLVPVDSTRTVDHSRTYIQTATEPHEPPWA
jgi:hypothetical protein